MPLVNLESKAEQAGKAYLDGLGTITAQVLTGKSSEDKEPPLVIIEANNSEEEEPEFSGNFWVEYSVTIKSLATVDVDGVDPKAADETLIDLVFSAFTVSDLAAQLTAALDDFTCQGLKSFKVKSSQEGNCWVNTLTFMALCCPSDL